MILLHFFTLRVVRNGTGIRHFNNMNSTLFHLTETSNAKSIFYTPCFKKEKKVTGRVRSLINPQHAAHFKSAWQEDKKLGKRKWPMKIRPSGYGLKLRVIIFANTPHKWKETLITLFSSIFTSTHFVIKILFVIVEIAHYLIQVFCKKL